MYTFLNVVIEFNDLQLRSGNLHNEKGVFSPYYRELLGVEQDLPSFR
jgi:hypothetical protein